MTALVAAPFDVAAGLEAKEPPEARGLRRDQVRLLVSLPDGRVEHSRFDHLPSFLRPGDLVVVNTSGTVAAALDTRAPDGTPIRLHVGGRLPGEAWLVEARLPNGASSLPYGADLSGATLSLPAGGTAVLWRHFPGSSRLSLADVDTPGGVPALMARHGQPIRYQYVDEPWPLEAYQTVYATEPGSAEMPSAGRPFSAELVTRLVAGGVAVAPILLHTGVSSLEGDERPYPEWYSVPDATARQVNDTRNAGGRVVAVGTTVVRALETVSAGGSAHAGSGWTELVVTPAHGVSVVDALITGFHDPRASHLAMLEAMAGRQVLEAAYAAAATEGYRWHEFGDSHLILGRL